MKYKVGMFGGSFEPLHVGHIHDIIRAASVCEKLYIMISWSKTRDQIPKEYRYRWILNSCKQLPNIKIMFVEDTATSKEEYNSDYYWENGANDIKKLIGEPIDAVFCGSDYEGTNRFESLYPESDVIYYSRKEVPIASTNIREDAIKNWDYIPNVAKPYFCKKVLIIGGESTGKSTLVENLAAAYNTNFVREIGRDTCEIAGGEDLMVMDDLIENMLRQKTEEMEQVKHSNRLLFIDTDALTTVFYSKLLLEDEYEVNACYELGYAINFINDFDLILFLEPDVSFVQDGTRNEDIKNDRIKYSNQLKQLFEARKIDFVSISGDYLNRFDTAKKLIEERLHITTVW